jgi:hypothetical protein
MGEKQNTGHRIQDTGDSRPKTQDKRLDMKPLLPNYKNQGRAKTCRDPCLRHAGAGREENVRFF